MKSSTKSPLIVITGPTASGKSGLALNLSQKWNGEIICADSRTVYKDMNIGTAKPTNEDQKKVRHWLLDIAEPGERFTAADFQKQAREAIKDIRSRGKVPFVVGGTGLYIDALALGFLFGPDVDTDRRARLEKMSTKQLHSLISKQRLVMPENKNNRRHLIRCIEKNNTVTTVKTLPNDDVFVMAVMVGREQLEQNIRLRIDQMFESGLLQETQYLLDKYGDDSEAMTSNAYPILRRLLAREIDESTARELCIIRDRQLAKRQLTWLRRHDHVLWLDKSEIEQKVEQILTTAA